MRGIDNAGNIYTTPAIDINIDQESDRPLVSISNPEDGGSVGGNLNILGTATDDDAIDRVEVRMGDGEFTKALGEEYWSFYLDTEDLDDGAYTVTVRAIDINGVEQAKISRTGGTEPHSTLSGSSNSPRGPASHCRWDEHFRYRTRTE